MNAKLIALALLVALAGCYKTKIQAGAPSAGPVYGDRQWFLIAGLVPLSDPAGSECPNGLSYAESKLGVMDVIIEIGTRIVGGVVGASVCDSEGDATAYGTCVSGAANLAGILIGTRTVEYQCK